MQSVASGCFRRRARSSAQDRPPWPSYVLEDQRRHVVRVRGNPRAMRALHAGRRRHAGNLVSARAALSSSFTLNVSRCQESRARRTGKTLQRAVKTVFRRAGKAPTSRRSQKWAKSPPPAQGVFATQNPIADFGSVRSLGKSRFALAYCR